MTDPIVRFVSAPSPDADVRFDFHLNNSDTGGERRTSDRQSWSWQPGALLGDADGIGSDFGLGQISFTHMVMGSRTDALRAMGVLSRELRRDENYLLFQLDEASPAMWLKTYKASAGALTFPYIDPDAPDGDVWLLDVSLPTESTSMGERRHFDLDVLNDPSQDGGVSVVLPEIEGDAPAPLRIRFPAGVVTTHMYPVVAVTHLHPDVEWPGTVFAEAEDLGAFGGATVVSDLGASGGGAVSFGSVPSSWTQVVNGSFDLPYAGRWKMYARLERTGSGTVQFKGSGDDLVSANITELSVDGITYVDLGDYVFPSGNMPSARPYFLDTANVGVSARTVSGSPGGKVDLIVAIPADLPLEQVEVGSSLTFVKPFVTSGEDTVTINPETEGVETMSLDTYLSVTPNQMRGSFPRVVPGAKNVLHLLTRRTNAATYEDHFTHVEGLGFSYQPRYVWLPSD